MTALTDALRHHQHGRILRAEQSYRAILTREPGHVDASYLLGVLLHQTQRSREALAWVQRAVERDSSRPEFFNTLGDVHRTLAEFGAAESAFARALALRPDYADAQLNLAQTLHAQGRVSEALILLFDAAESQPAHQPVRHLLASMLNGVALGSATPLVRAVLLQLCTDDSINTQSIAGAVLGAGSVRGQRDEVHLQGSVDRHSCVRGEGDRQGRERESGGGVWVGSKAIYDDRDRAISYSRGTPIRAIVSPLFTGGVETM